MRTYIPTSTARRMRMREPARDLRQRATASETLLWEALRGRKLGAKFRRQQPIGPFVVDFYCSEHRLVIEVDGAVHASQQEYDEERQDLLEQCGYRVLRLAADEVEQELSGSLERIRTALTPPLPRQGEGAGG